MKENFILLNMLGNPMVIKPLLVWLILVFLFLLLLIRKYTFGKWTKENPNPYEKETLGMPRGVFRSVITVTLLFTVILFEIAGVPESNFHQLIIAFQMMIAFYFGGKVFHHMVKSDHKKTQAIADGIVEEKKKEIEFENTRKSRLIIESKDSDNSNLKQFAKKSFADEKTNFSEMDFKEEAQSPDDFENKDAAG